MDFKKINYIERNTKEVLIENVPGEKYLKFLYYNPFGVLPLEGVVKRKFLSSYYGKLMDKESSKEKIVSFIEEHNINMEESLLPVEEFSSFNDFFVRKLKKGTRKINENDDVLVTPADGKIFILENISTDTKFFLKGDEFSFEEFFQDKKLGEKYLGGTMIIVRLAPVDYHRFHFPASGEISSSKLIDGWYYSVSTHAIRKNFRIFCENKREYSILKTENFKDICIAEIGATMVGGIVQTYAPNTKVIKGEEKGYFHFGGSTVIMILEKNAEVAFDLDLIENSKKGIETKVYMGERIGVKKKV